MAGSQSYFQGLCLQKLGQSEKATALFQGLVDSGNSMLRQPAAAGGGRGFGRPESARARTANAHYLMGLGYLGLNDREKAKAELGAALQSSPDLLGARTALASVR
jgi:Tfp pilus assembly protein PilF